MESFPNLLRTQKVLGAGGRKVWRKKHFKVCLAEKSVPCQNSFSTQVISEEQNRKAEFTLVEVIT